MRKQNFFLKSIIVIILLFINSIIGYSQSNTWYKTWGDPDKNENGIKVIQSFDGGYVAIGHRETTFHETFLIKYDYLGNFQWVKLLGDSTGRMPYDIRQTRDSGFVITGNSFGAFLAKTDKNGNFLWQRNYQNLNPFTYSYSVRQTLDGGYILGGSYTDYINPSGKGIVIKTDSLGYVQWERQYMDSLFNSYGDVIQESSGYYYVSGATQKIQPLRTWQVVKKLDGLGNIIWTKIFGVNIGGGNISQLKDQKLIVISNRTDYSFPVITKLDTSGNIIWYKEYPSLTRTYYTSIDKRENIILTSSSSSPTTIRLMKFDTNGLLLKQRNLLYSGYYNIGGNCTNSTNDSGYIISGNVIISTPFYDYGDMLIVKTDSAFNAPVIIDINNISINIPNNFEVFPNYPNPFNPTTTIKFIIPNNGYVNIIIYDLLGKKVFSNREYRLKGYNEKVLDFCEINLCSGVYFISVNFDLKSKLIKAIYLK